MTQPKWEVFDRAGGVCEICHKESAVDLFYMGYHVIAVCDGPCIYEKAANDNAIIDQDAA